MKGKKTFFSILLAVFLAGVLAVSYVYAETAGNTDIGALNTGIWNFGPHCGSFVMPEDGTVDTFHVHTIDEGAEENVSMAIYASSSGAVSPLSPQSDEITTTNGTGWETLSVTGTLSLTGGMAYLVCGWVEDVGQQDFSYDSGEGYSYFGGTYNTWPTSIDFGADSEISPSMYITYTPTAAAEATTTSTGVIQGSGSISGSGVIQ